MSLFKVTEVLVARLSSLLMTKVPEGGVVSTMVVASAAPGSTSTLPAASVAMV